MKKMNQLIKIWFISMIISSIVLVVPLKATAMTNILTESESQDGAVYTNVSGNIIFKNSTYWTTAVIVYEDGHKEITIMASEDQKSWVRYSGFSFDSLLENIDIKLVYFNNQYIIYYHEAGRNIVYTSADMIFWDIKTNDLNPMMDIQYDGSLYWILDSEGTVYNSLDLGLFTYITKLDKIEGQSLLASDLLVVGNNILVSHYNPKWGQKNTHNGIQIYNQTQDTWADVQGIENESGLICDLVSIDQQLILVVSNIYKKSSPIQCFTSGDGSVWEESKTYTAVVRSLWPVAETDSGILLMIKKLGAQISNYSNNKIPVPVEIALDDKLIDFNQNAVLYSGKVMVPIRDFFMELGGSVEWKSEEQQVICVLLNDTFIFDLDDKICYKNGVNLQLATPAIMLNEKSVIPVREISENLGLKVEWDSRNYQVKLVTNPNN